MRNLKFFILFSLLLTIISNTGITSSEVRKVTLQVRSKVEVDDKFVTLGDIAVVQTKDENLKKALRAVKLCKSPPPRRTFTWDIPHLKSALREALATNKEKTDVSLASLSIQGAKIVQISTSSKKILSEKIVLKAKEFIEKHNQQKDIAVEVLTKPRAVNVPSGEVELKVLKPKRIKESGYLPISVQILVDKEPYTTIPMLLKVGQNLHSQPSQSKFSGNSAITDRDKSTPLIKPGDLVVLMVKMKSIEITTLAKALQRATKGELIRVMNVDSKKIIAAEVVDKNKVKALINLGAF